MHHSEVVHLNWPVPWHSVSDSLDMNPPLTLTLS